MFKKIIVILIVFALSITMVGCLSFSKELSERLIVSVMGIDLEGESFCLSAACLSTAGGDSEQKSFNAEHISYESDSLNEAFLGLNEKTNKSLFWGQATAILIGENAAKERLSDIVSFLSKEDSFRMNIHILIYNGFAKEAVGMKTNDNVTIGDDIEKLLSNMPKGADVSVKLYELSSTIDKGGTTGFLPILETKENEEILSKEMESSRTVKVGIEEMLVINKNSIFGAVSLDNSLWILLLQNKVKEIDSLGQIRDKLSGIVLNSLNTSMRYKNGQIIAEVYATAYKNKGKTDNREIKEEIAEIILINVRESYDYYYKELGVDVLNICALLQQNGIEEKNCANVPVVFSVKLNLIS